MATILTIKSINSLKAFADFIEKQLPKSKGNLLWFRGTGKENYKLSPSIHRHPSMPLPENIIKMEVDIMNRFVQRSVPFLTKPLDITNDWEVLFFMQHYGIPTRLLDWSENPFVALYFALTSAKYGVVGKKRVFENDAAIWMLDPIAWNMEALKDWNFQGGILSAQDHLTSSYKPRTEFGGMREIPICIFGTHNSARIVSQRGVFTVFGKSVKPMEDVYVDKGFPQDCLIKLIFPKDNIDTLLTSLITLGTTDSVIYPDLEGLSKEIRRFFSFNL